MAEPQMFNELSARLQKTKRSDTTSIRDNTELSSEHDYSNEKTKKTNKPGHHSGHTDDSAAAISTAKKTSVFQNFKKVFKRTKKKKDGKLKSSQEALNTQQLKKSYSEPDLIRSNNDDKQNNFSAKMQQNDSQFSKPTADGSDSKVLSDEEDPDMSREKNNSFKDAQQYIRSSLRKLKIKRKKSVGSDSSTPETAKPTTPDRIKPAHSVTKKLPPIAPRPKVKEKPELNNFELDDEDSFFTKTLTRFDDSTLSSPEASFALGEIGRNEPQKMETSAAKDRIRVAPQGRRKPSKYRSPPPITTIPGHPATSLSQIDQSPSSSRHSSVTHSKESLNSEKPVSKTDSFSKQRTLSDSLQSKPPKLLKSTMSSERITNLPEQAFKTGTPQRSKSTNSRENIRIQTSVKSQSTHASKTSLHHENSLTKFKPTAFKKDSYASYTGFDTPQFSRDEEELRKRRSKNSDFESDKRHSLQSIHQRSFENVYSENSSPDTRYSSSAKVGDSGVSDQDSYQKSNEDLTASRKVSKDTDSYRESGEPEERRASFHKSEASLKEHNNHSLERKIEESNSASVFRYRNSLKDGLDDLVGKDQDVRSNSLDDLIKSKSIPKRTGSLQGDISAFVIAPEYDPTRASRDKSSTVNLQGEKVNNRVDGTTGKQTMENISTTSAHQEFRKSHGERTFAITSPTRDLELPEDFLTKNVPKTTEKLESEPGIIEKQPNREEKPDKPQSGNLRSMEFHYQPTTVSSSKTNIEIKNLGRSLKPNTKTKNSLRDKENEVDATNDSPEITESDKMPEFHRISLKKVPKTSDFLENTGNGLISSVEVQQDGNPNASADSSHEDEDLNKQKMQSMAYVIRKDDRDYAPTQELKLKVHSPKTLKTSNDIISHDVMKSSRTKSSHEVNPAPKSPSPIENTPGLDLEFRRFSLKKVPKRDDYHAREESSLSPVEFPVLTQQTPDLDLNAVVPGHKSSVEAKKDFDTQRSTSVGRSSPKLLTKSSSKNVKPFSFQSQDIISSQSLPGAETQRLRDTSLVDNVKDETPSWVKLAKAKQNEKVVSNDLPESSVKPSSIALSTPPALSAVSEDENLILPNLPSSPLLSPSSPVSILSRGALSFKAQPIENENRSICIVCQKTAYMVERCEIDKHILHINCAKCEVCGRKLAVGGIYVRHNKPYCSHHKKF